MQPSGNIPLQNFLAPLIWMRPIPSVTTASYINVALMPDDRNFSICLFSNLLKTTEIIWSTFSLSILKEYKTIIHSQSLFGFLKISTLCSSLLFPQPKFWFFIEIFQLLSLKNKFIDFYNIHCLVLVIKFSINFYFYFYLFLTIFHILILQNY